MSGYVIQSKSNVLAVQHAVAVAPAKISSFFTGNVKFNGFSVTNNDVAIAMYVGKFSDVSATKYEYKVAAGDRIEDNREPDEIGLLYIMSESGTPNALMTLFNQ